MSGTIILRSRDRNSGSSSSFKLSFSGDALEGKYEVMFVNIQNTIYTIRSNQNDRIYFNENGSDKTAIITAGYYTQSTLPAAVKSALDTASGGFATFTVTISSTTQKMTISSTQNFSLKFATYTTYSAALTLGYNQSDTSAATSAIANNIINLAEPLSININIKQSNINNFKSPKGSYGSILVPLDAAFGSFKFLKHNDLIQYLNFQNRASIIDVEIRDLDGNALDLNGSDWELCIRKI